MFNDCEVNTWCRTERRAVQLRVNRYHQQNFILAIRWELPLSQHVNFCVAMQNERIACERIPQRVLASLATAQLDDEDFRAGNARMDDDGYARGDDDEDSVSDIPRSIWNALAPFQKYGVSWIVRNNGRALLADEPGFGKTIQAIGAA